MTITKRAAAWAALGILFAGLVGCGGGPVKVAGQVVYDDGQPAKELAGGGIVFSSDNGKDSSSGDIGEDGRFVLSYRGKNDGAMPGSYKVAIQPNDPGWETEAARRRGSPIPLELFEPQTSPVTVTIEGRTDDLKLTVPRKATK